MDLTYAKPMSQRFRKRFHKLLTLDAISGEINNAALAGFSNFFQPWFSQRTFCLGNCSSRG
jgi:hypothetical protein